MDNFMDKLASRKLGVSITAMICVLQSDSREQMICIGIIGVAGIISQTILDYLTPASGEIVEIVKPEDSDGD